MSITLAYHPVSERTFKRPSLQNVICSSKSFQNALECIYLAVLFQHGQLC